MKLYYRHVPRGNFGDDLNPWLWGQLLPDVMDDNDNVLFVGIGSILNDRLPERPFKVVFGSGVGYGKPPSISSHRWKIYCVRGPLSARVLGLQTAFGISDAALLVRTVQLPQSEKLYKVSYMPHQTSAALGDWKIVCDTLGINFIHPSEETETVLSNILGSELLITEAMHGAIVADAFRVPWIPVRTSFRIPRFKWLDWCQSLELEYRPVRLPLLWRRDKLVEVLLSRLSAKRPRLKPAVELRLRKLVYSAGIVSKLTETRKIARATKRLRKISQRDPSLSSPHAVESATSRLQERLEEFKREYESGSFERYQRKP